MAKHLAIILLLCIFLAIQKTSDIGLLKKNNSNWIIKLTT